MAKRKQAPCALTIAGSDSGGGAGIQADLHTFGQLGVHGTTAITCLTAQNPRGVSGVESCSPRMVTAQLKAVFAELPPAAAKTGMLYSESIIGAVAKFLQSRAVPLVVDPVMVSTSGATLLQPGAVRALAVKLFPLAALITPNLQEAGLLAGARLGTVEDLRYAARLLHERHGGAWLIKGGHLRGLREAVDIFYDGKKELLLSAPFVQGLQTHGTGCTYSAAICAYLARGLPLPRAVSAAKQFVTQAIASSRWVGSHSVLGWKG